MKKFCPLQLLCKTIRESAKFINNQDIAEVRIKLSKQVKNLKDFLGF